MTDISSDDSSVSSFETLNDGYSEASQEDAESIGKDSTSSLLNDVGDNQDLDSELSFEAPEEEDQSVVSSEAPSNDEDSVQASDDDETASLGYWDDSEWEEPSDQALFCSNCQQIPFEEIWNGGHHHMKWTEHDSCPICMMIASFVPVDCGEPQQVPHYCSHCSQLFHGEYVDCHRPVDIRLSRSGKYDIVVSLQSAQAVPLAVGHLTNLPLQASDRKNHRFKRDTMRTIKSWVAHCHKKHKECQINAEGVSLEGCEPFLPSRVIDVGEPDTQNSPYLMVSGETQRGIYTILSHCWGQMVQLRTFGSNISEHCQQLQWESLCKTYQDAITVTRALKVRYLWIDSLCIVQDSDNDWDLESARMAQYYGNAYCTISADAASDGSQGCFIQRSEYVRARLPFQTFACMNKHTTVLTNKESPSVALAKDPMHRRAWCVQERLLSRRTLHFSADQVYFECKRCLTAEDGRYHGRGYISNDFYEVVALKEVGKTETSKPQLKQLSASQRYYKIAAWFSTCLLTFSEDKLRALAGLQQSYSVIYGARFHAAVWFHATNLAQTVETLWWAPTIHCQGGRHLKECNWSTPRSFPTWSWVSCNVSIEVTRLYGIHHLRELALRSQLTQPTLLRCFDDCPCGNHQYPVLAISTKLFHKSLDDPDIIFEPDDRSSFRFTDGTEVDISLHDHPRTEPDFLILALLQNIDSQALDFSDRRQCVKIQNSAVSNVRHGRNRWFQSALLLRLSEHSCRGTHYKRIGAATITSAEGIFEEREWETIYLD